MMTQISISDISKNPSILNKLNDVTEVLNKKTRQIKGVFIPSALLENFQTIFKELEYQKFVKRNRSLQSFSDDTLLDGLEDAY